MDSDISPDTDFPGWVIDVANSLKSGPGETVFLVLVMNEGTVAHCTEFAPMKFPHIKIDEASWSTACLQEYWNETPERNGYKCFEVEGPKDAPPGHLWMRIDRWPDRDVSA